MAPFSKRHKSIKTRNMKSISEKAFLRDDASIDWKETLGFSGDTNALLQQFSSIRSLVIKNAPLSAIFVRFRKVQHLDKL